jgi:hypothetical protein
VNLAQLESTLEANKGAALACGLAAVGGLVLWQKRKGSAAGSTAGATSSSSSTTPAGVVPYSGGGQTTSLAGAGGVYDSTSADLAGYLGPQLDSIGSRLTALENPSASSPIPVASTLVSPAGTGSYVRTPNGSIAEVESDGSLFGLTYNQWVPVSSSGYQSVPSFGSQTLYSSAANVAAGTAKAKS